MDQTISAIKTVCHDQHVPIAFPFERRKLAYILYKKASISCIGILDYDGARDIFSQLLVALKEAQEAYWNLTKEPEDMLLCNNDAVALNINSVNDAV